MLIDASFSRLLQGFDYAELSNDAGTIYGLWPDLQLACLNPAWSQFARENGGDERLTADYWLGRSVLDAIAPPLQLFFAEHFGQALSSGRPWEHVYECSSDVIYRKFRMTAFPLGAAEGLLVVHSLASQAPQQRQSACPVEEKYRDGDGIIHQCAHCRRVRRQSQGAPWDWIADWVRRAPSQTSHGICPPCFGFYYGDEDMDRYELRPFSTGEL